MSAIVTVLVSDLPAMIRDSVRAVLASHGLVITKAMTPGGVLFRLLDDELEKLLREIGNNAAQVVAASDMGVEE